ncbi:MAG: hypothetical protein AAGD35_08720 [Actinomycetota bacterium]
MTDDPAAAPVLPDGDYEVMVVDTDGGEGGRCTLSLAVSAGLGMGEVVDLVMSGIDIDPMELLGLPGIVEVRQGEPRFRLS